MASQLHKLKGVPPFFGEYANIIDAGGECRKIGLIGPVQPAETRDIAPQDLPLCGNDFYLAGIRHIGIKRTNGQGVIACQRVWKNIKRGCSQSMLLEIDRCLEIRDAIAQQIVRFICL